jgi:hypothetical protein
VNKSQSQTKNDNRASGDPLPVPALSHPHAEQCHQAGWCCQCPACSWTEQLILSNASNPADTAAQHAHGQNSWYWSMPSSRLMLLPSMLMDRTADTEKCHRDGWCCCPACSRTEQLILSNATKPADAAAQHAHITADILWTGLQCHAFVLLCIKV